MTAAYTPVIETERDAFEQFVLRGTLPGEGFLDRAPNGDYLMNVTAGGWACWQARAAIATYERDASKALNAVLIASMKPRANEKAIKALRGFLEAMDEMLGDDEEKMQAGALRILLENHEKQGITLAKVEGK